MSISTSRAYVWVWLPGQAHPVPAGVLGGPRNQLSFRYGERYISRPDAISLAPTLPLGDELFEPTLDMATPSAIRDAAPDAWGRRVIMSQLAAGRGPDVDTGSLDELTYLLRSDSNRVGALDFQRTPDTYSERGGSAELPDLHAAAELVSQGAVIPEQLRAALESGTGIGGARPKALVTLNGVPSLVKFTLSTDVFPSVEAEALASKLAERAGLRTAPILAERLSGKYALVAKRFDREAGARKLMVSALTLTGRGEMTSRYSSYDEVVQKVAELSSKPASVGPEMFDRVAFNMMISNSDDHLRNHAVFWDGVHAELTPAYDLAPGERREGAEMTLTLPYGKSGEKLANLERLAQNAGIFSLNTSEARDRIAHLRGVISSEISDAADEVQIASGTLQIVGRSFLHETVTRDLPRVIAVSASNQPRVPKGSRTAGKPSGGQFAKRTHTGATGSGLNG